MSPPALERLDAGVVSTLVLTRADVRRHLDMNDCIEAVERAFLEHARGLAIPPGVLAAHAPGGGFHVKTAGSLSRSGDQQPIFVAKVNANFPANPDQHGLPTIQGVIALFDACDGRLLALLDSAEVTSVRTAAATGVAAKYLARPDAATVTICGCGEQSRHQLRALACVRALRRVFAFDLDDRRAARVAAFAREELGVDARPVTALGDDTRESDIWVTCTTAHRWLLGREHVKAGTFVAAVGADNPDKQEIEPELLAASTVVADVLDQCVASGDLHHAIAAGVMTREDVRGELADLIAGVIAGRVSPNEITIFDSTGTALEDVAAAGIVYRRALADGSGFAVELGAVPGEAGRRRAGTQ